MAARGPDGAGHWRSACSRIALGHRRLAIIDLSAAGAQPMHEPATGNVIVFNGEIYNYRALRRELQAGGAVFRSGSDTEVLLHLYARHSEAMVQRLRGMFAFAIWDARRHCLFLARDPLGIKPLYYADDGHTFSFASQVKALVAGGVPENPSAAGLAGFFIWGHVPEPWTWLAAVRALPAGCTLTVALDAALPAPRPYFDLREEIVRAESSPAPHGDAVQAALEAVGDSVCHHLVADVPVGVFLSAGRDSTLVAALASRHASEPLRTVTLGFDEYRGTPLDEVPIAEQAAALLGARHRTVRTAREDFAAAQDSILDAMDQPSIDGVNTWLVSRAAAQAGLKVALSGLGGDGLFGGYSSFTQVPRLARRARLLSGVPWIGRALRVACAPVVQRIANPKWASLAEYGGTLAGAWMLRRALFMPWELPHVMDPAMARDGLAELALLDDLRARIRGIRSPALQVMALEMSCYMRQQLLRDADWAGMAHSLEIRVPLVDVDLLRRWLPWAVRQIPFDRQRLLQRAAPDIAAAVGTRAESGFAVPVQQWVADRGASSRRNFGLRGWAQRVGPRFAPAAPKLRIGVLLTDAFGGIGGIAKFNRDLCNALAAMPDVAEVVALPRLVQREPETIPGKVTFEAARDKFAYALRVLRWLPNGQRLDLVICGHINLLPLAWPLSRVKRCPLLLVVHGVDAWRSHHNPLVPLLLPRVNLIAAVSRYTIDRMRAWTGLPQSRFRLLPNCVDLDRVAPRPRNAALAQRLGLEGRRVLLTVGRLAGRERFKGFDEVMEALTELQRERADFVYVIVGDGDDRARLVDKARALGVADRVVFTGYVSEEEKLDLYNLADVYVMPSRGEGFGIVYLEAMACGVPTVGSSVDGSRDALRDGRLGLLVDPGDRAQILSAIRIALDKPRGRPDGLEYFSESAYRRRVAALVREVIQATCRHTVTGHESESDKTEEEPSR